MKKNTLRSVLALALALLMTVGVLSGCQKELDENGNEIIDKGAEINMYISSFPYDLDPGRIHYDSDLYKFFSLIYEPLFTIDENGSLKGGLIKDWEYEEDERDEKLKLQMKLRSTSWSDGVAVDSDDIAYTFKRLLDPNNSNPAASMLFPIENARDAKAGMVTVDDVGFSAINASTIEIVFEKEFTDVEYFLRCLASPVFTPLREDVVTQYGDDWAQPLYLKELRDGEEAFSSIVTNGPFAVKEWIYNKGKPTSLLLERSTYYRNLNVEQAYDTYVKPYRIMLNFRNDADAQIENYNLNKEVERVFLIGEFTKEGYEANKKNIKSYANGSSYTYYFNANNETLKDARVRKALSIALDRNEIANIVGKGVVPATGYVPTGIEADAKGKKDYRSVADAVISAEANLDEAKKLLKEAKVTSGSLTLNIRDDAAWENDVAKYAADVWKKLGFNVSIKKVSALSDKESKLSEYERKLATGDFDIIGFDQCALSPDAYSFLVPYATQYSGSIVPIDDELEAGKLPSTAHVTGFSDKDYDALIGVIGYDADANDSIAPEAGILCAKKAAERLEIYKQAEAMLAEKVPCAPLFFGVNNYMVSGKLSGVKVNNLGNPILSGTKLSGYKNFKMSEALGEVEVEVEAE